MKFALLVLCSFVSLKTWSQQRFDVLITEIMADPTPQVSLPNAEYIEVKNNSGKDINLQGWRLSTSSALSGLFPSYTLAADSFLVLTSTGNTSSFTSYGRVLGIPSFPSLANDGTLLSLISKEGKTIHFVNYATTWYENAAKEDGGWSLEMIDISNSCSGKSNWKASIDNTGGTPGKKNSVAGVNKDQSSPRLINAYLKDNSTIVLQFDESLDSITAVNINAYQLNPSIAVTLVNAAPPFMEVTIKTSTPLAASILYQLTATGIKDCAGNEINGANKIPIGLPEEAAAKDMVLNELLFNPKPDGYDYVELYNRSNKIIDASKLYLSSRSSSGALASLKKLSELPHYIFPGEYVVATEDASWLQRSYLVKNTNQVFELSTLPSMPDDKGVVVISNVQGTVVDEVAYSDDWHFDLLADDEGVALERIDPEGSSQETSNWHSAASTAGFGTPTYKNSQYKQAETINALIAISPKIFSPDNDGLDDVATIQYQVEKPGYVANINIFDVTGKAVRYLVKNATLGLKGSWNWDGLDEKGQKLPIGNYIVYTEVFNLEGKKKTFKNVIVLARRLN